MAERIFPRTGLSGFGGVIHPSVPGGQATGLVRIFAETLTYDDLERDISFEYPLAQCRPVLGGHENGILYFQPEDAGDPVFYLDDLALLDRLVELVPPERRHLYEALRRKGRPGSGPFACCLTFVAAFGALLVALFGASP